MPFSVRFKNNKVLNMVKKMPVLEQKKLANLIEDLSVSGPIQKNWRNFSSIGINKYHCHLSYKWVACWEYFEEKDISIKNIIKVIEVYYAGSREDAPY